MAFDGDNYYAGYQGLQAEDEPMLKTKNTEVLKLFASFVKEWNVKGEFIYKDQLKANIALHKYFLKVDLADIEQFDQGLCKLIRGNPIRLMSILEAALLEAYLGMNNTDLGGPVDRNVKHIQLQISSAENIQQLRKLTTQSLGKLINVTGIIINSGKTTLRGRRVKAVCKDCKNSRFIELTTGFEGVQLPRFCEKSQPGKMCSIEPYVIVTDDGDTEYIDFQVLKIQECPDSIPTGEVPRTYQVCCERYLVDRLVPGSRVVITGVLTIAERRAQPSDSIQRSIRTNYIVCYSYSLENTGSRRISSDFNAVDKSRFMEYSKDDKIYDKIATSMGEAIFGHDDIKRSIACLLFGGSAKHLPDGSKLRGDINVLLLGDPSTAKSQFLKFVQKVAPIAVYTSGKGSSAAGLTAAIIKDPNSGEFQLEGGALVLADGGVVCIDEFDKMRPQDRVAIHEAMEQQTISVAKAGITTILNSRTSVLAAANPIFGRYDDVKKISDQIDLQTTILSRFDCIFIVRDIRNEESDKRLAKHIIGLHSRANVVSEYDKTGQGKNLNVNLEELKNYIMYAKMNCTPKMNEEAAVTLQNLYIEDRKKVRIMKQEKRSHIPVTVRQLEAIIRMSEAIAKMRLSAEVKRTDIEEAHRLFSVSTMNAIKGGVTASGYGSNPELMMKAEEAIKRRVDIGSKLSHERLMEDFENRFSPSTLMAAINNLIQKEDFLSIQDGKALLRKR